MPRITGSYPRDQDLLIDGAVDAGVFGSQSDALREFVRTYFESHDTERIAAAVALYERERITLGAAARLAAVDRWTMRELLAEHGVEPRTAPRDADAVAAKIAATLDRDGRSAETNPQSNYWGRPGDAGCPGQNHYHAPTQSGTMATVDSKGRIVLPKEVRERLSITPGTEVEVRTEDGKAVVEPEADPAEIIERMDQLVAETAPERGEMTPLDEGVDPLAEKHRDAIRRGADSDA